MSDKKRDYKDQKDQIKTSNNQQYHHHFQVKYLPKGFFSLFKKDIDPYIYEKKFSCDLPKNIIPPKSFHYPFSIENFCQSDLLTMDFDLKKNREILTDPKINTSVHQDFINNSLELIYPNLTTITKERTDEEQKLKKKILEIIEDNEEINQETNPVLNEIPYFLRRQIYLRPSTKVDSGNVHKVNEKNKEKKPQKMTKTELKNIIDQSFQEIDKIKVGIKHPDPQKKNLTAKKVYDIIPMLDMPNIKFIEYLFPNEPSKDSNIGENYLIPDHFLIEKNEDSSSIKTNNLDTTFSLYTNNKLKNLNNDDDENLPKTRDIAEYYSYEKEFATTKLNESDVFNRYFMVMDKTNNKMKISPIAGKYSFRQYKKFTEIDDENRNDDEEKTLLQNKRKRDIILVPQSITKEELDSKKKWLLERGYMTGFTERKVNEVDYTEATAIQKEKENELMQNENKESEKEDVFGEMEEEEQEYQEKNNDNDDDNDNDNDYKDNIKENDEKKNVNSDYEDDDENENDKNENGNIEKDKENKEENNEEKNEENEEEEDPFFSKDDGEDE